jgi:hypothetical protein
MANMRKLHGKLGIAHQASLNAGGRYILRESQEIVPVQLGTLKRSGVVYNAGGLGYKAVVIVGYGGDAKYAIYVHEDPTKAHGAAFNIKHADKIARSGGEHTIKRGKNKGKTVWKPTLWQGTAHGGFFPRGENQQYKFLEKPFLTKRVQMLAIMRKTYKQIAARL